MTIEQVKAEAKKRFDKDLTDEQARAFLAAYPAGALQDEELADVAGGVFSKPLLPPIFEDYIEEHPDFKDFIEKMKNI